MRYLAPEHPIENILISNTAEAFFEPLSASWHTPAGAARLQHEITLSQRAFLWEDDNKIVITSPSIPAQILNHHRSLFHWKNSWNWSPAVASIKLSDAILNDENMIHALLDVIDKNPRVRFSPYATTDEFVRLIRAIEARAPSREFENHVSYGSAMCRARLDTKAGFRNEIMKLVGSIPNLAIPEGFICSTYEDVVEAGLYFARSGRGFVVKSDLGESGWGMKIFEGGNPLISFEVELNRLFAGDPIWTFYPIIVEEFVDSISHSNQRSPSTEVFVGPSGPCVTYSCAQVVSLEGVFQGIALGPEAIEHKVRALIECIANDVGQRYWELGYRGFFDIDFIVTNGGKPIVVETNMRRTGGTHVYDIAKTLGTAQRGHHLISDDCFQYGDAVLPIETVFEKFLPSAISDGEGVILTSISETAPTIGFVAIGATLTGAGRIRDRFVEALYN